MKREYIRLRQNDTREGGPATAVDTSRGNTRDNKNEGGAPKLQLLKSAIDELGIVKGTLATREDEAAKLTRKLAEANRKLSSAEAREVDTRRTADNQLRVLRQKLADTVSEAGLREQAQQASESAAAEISTELDEVKHKLLLTERNEADSRQHAELQLDTLRKELAATKAIATAAEEEVGNSEAKVAALHTELEAAKQDLNTTTERLVAAEISEATTRHDADQQTEDAQQKLTEVHRMVNRAEEDLHASQEEAVVLRAELDETKQRLSLAEAKEAETRCSTDDQLRALERELIATARDLAEAEDAVAASQNELDTSKAQIAVLHTELEAAVQAQKQAASARRDAVELLEATQHELTDSRIKLGVAESSLQESRNEIVTLREELAKMEGKLAELEETNAELSTTPKVASLQEELNDACRGITVIKDALGASEDEVAALRAELTETRHELALAQIHREPKTRPGTDGSPASQPPLLATGTVPSRWDGWSPHQTLEWDVYDVPQAIRDSELIKKRLEHELDVSRQHAASVESERKASAEEAATLHAELNTTKTQLHTMLDLVRAQNGVNTAINADQSMEGSSLELSKLYASAVDRVRLLTSERDRDSAAIQAALQTEVKLRAMLEQRDTAIELLGAELLLAREQLKSRSVFGDNVTDAASEALQYMEDRISRLVFDNRSIAAERDILAQRIADFNAVAGQLQGVVEQN